MLKPSAINSAKPGQSSYEFVVAVAKKAREISSIAEENHTPLEEKPVSLALEAIQNSTDPFHNNND